MLRSILEQNKYGVCGFVLGGNTSLEGEMSNEADFEEQVLLNCFYPKPLL